MFPSQSEINELKRQYGEIFVIGNYIVRQLKLGEFSEIENLESIDAEDRIVELAVLWPENKEKISAGHVSSLANEIIEVSGFMDPAGILDEARAKSKQIRSMMYAFVLATQEKYTEEDLYKLTFAQLADKVALAENIIEIQKAIYDPTVEMRLVIGQVEEEQEDSEPIVTSKDWDDISRGTYYSPDRPSVAGTATTADPIAQKLKLAMG